MRNDIPNIIETIRGADQKLILLGFIVYFSSTIIIAFRLQKVMGVQSVNLSPREAVSLTFIGFFFNNFLPTSFGGDVVKAYYAGKKSNKKAASFAGVFMDRVLAILPFTLIPALTVTFFAHKIESKVLISAIYLLFFFCVILLWLLLHRSTAKFLAYILEPFKEKIWYEKIKNGYDFLNIYARHKIVLCWTFILSILAQVLFIISVYIFAKAIGIDTVSCGIFFIVVPIVGVVTILPSLNGLGVREGSFVYLLKPYILPEKAFAISILVLATLFVFSIIGGIIYLSQKSLFAFKAEELA